MDGIAIIIFSMNMDAPMAQIIKYRNGAFLSLNGLYAVLSIITATIAVHRAANKNAKAKGRLYFVKKSTQNKLRTL